tara:strand:+ start:4039 stop:4422 length:384 start_codon:yes stop_codon:yes gene_type:complete
MNQTNSELKEQAIFCLTKHKAFKNTEGCEVLAAKWLQSYKDTKGLMNDPILSASLQLELMPNFRGSNCRDFNLVTGHRFHYIEFTYDMFSRITEETFYDLKNSSSMIFTNKKEAKKILNKIKKDLVY